MFYLKNTLIVAILLQDHLCSSVANNFQKDREEGRGPDHFQITCVQFNKLVEFFVLRG